MVLILNDGTIMTLSADRVLPLSTLEYALAYGLHLTVSTYVPRSYAILTRI